jgi:glycine cleavage system H protein
MSAGVIGYRLCNRGFDCEHCLFDAAMRGPPSRARAVREDRPWPATIVPQNRLYSTGHSWLMPVADASVWRLGLDAFATGLLGGITGVHSADTGRVLRAGETACVIDLGIGTVAIDAPLPCRAVRSNDGLAERPERLIAEPYDAGWLLEVAVTDLAGLLAFVSPGAAMQRFDHDLARFTRTVAVDLIAATDVAAGTAALLSGQPLTDLRALLGPTRFLELLHDFIH